MKAMRATMSVLLALALIVALGCTINPGMKKTPVPLTGAFAAPERTPIYQRAGWTIARGSIHNHTTYSDGCRSPEDLLELARRQGMAVLSFNDHREGKYCIGKLCVNVGGVSSYGYEKYWAHLDRVKAKASEQGMVVLNGIEVIPYFYQMGKVPFLVVDGLQHHFVIYGVDDLRLFENMPTRQTINSLRPESRPDDAPWREFVDYLDAHGAIVSAAHVEEGADMWIGPLHGSDPPVPKNIHRLRGLTAFAVLPFGFHDSVAGPGGLWDTTLIEYLVGMRPRPLWAVGDTDYHGPEAGLAIATTLFYLKEFTEKDVLAAMREGRMVALQGNAFQNSYVAEWWVSEGKMMPENQVMLGRTFTVGNVPVIKFALDHPVAGCKTRLIRNGVLAKEVAGTELWFEDTDAAARREPVFYRVEVQGPRENYGKFDDYPTQPWSEIFVNPIFVRFSH
jgi:hypothetical protein